MLFASSDATPLVVSIGTWGVTVIAMVGMHLNSRRNRWGFACWTFTNSCWIIVGLIKGIPALAAQNAIYLYFSITGFLHWTRAHLKELEHKKFDAQAKRPDQRVSQKVDSGDPDRPGDST